MNFYITNQRINKTLRNGRKHSYGTCMGGAGNHFDSTPASVHKMQFYRVPFGLIGPSTIHHHEFKHPTLTFSDTITTVDAFTKFDQIEKADSITLVDSPSLTPEAAPPPGTIIKVNKRTYSFPTHKRNFSFAVQKKNYSIKTSERKFTFKTKERQYYD